MSDLHPHLTVDTLLGAYAAGIFPMAESRDSDEVFWMNPNPRGVLPLGAMHLSRSLRRRIRRGGYQVTLNADFTGVLDACADREETWINPPIRTAYIGLHHAGHAHSCEIWYEDVLIGGVYGVALRGAFFGESMFSRRTDGSKLALAHLTDHLLRCGFSLFDTQFLTAHLASLGGIELPRLVYRAQLATALQKRDAHILNQVLTQAAHPLVQRNTQTS